MSGSRTDTALDRTADHGKTLAPGYRLADEKRLWLGAERWTQDTGECGSTALEKALAALPTSLVSGLPFAEGDHANLVIPLPHDIDLGAAIDFEVWWMHSDNGASLCTTDGPCWLLVYDGIAAAEAVAGTGTLPNTGLTTALPDEDLDQHTLEDKLQVLTGGQISAADAAAKLTRNDLLALRIELDDTGAGGAAIGADESHLIGLVMKYQVQRDRLLGGD